MIFKQVKHIARHLHFGGINFLLPLILYFFITSYLPAQNDTANFRSTDKKTSLFYEQKNWDSLILTGNQSVKSGIDYFYLRLRMGIAYYHKGNYQKTSQHLEKALKFYASDATAMEYLYYSYLLSNRKSEAKVLSLKFKTHLENKLQTKKIGFFESLYFETGPAFSNNIKKNEIKKISGSENQFYLEQDLNDDKYYVHAGMGVNFSKRISAYFGYSFLGISKLKQIYIPALVVAGNNERKLYTHEYQLAQNEFYGNLKFIVGRGFLFTPAYHMLNVRYNTIYPDIESPPLINQGITQSDTTFINHIVSVSISKYVSLFNLGIVASWSNLNNKYQYQLGGIFTVYPSGNLDLYTTSNLVSAWQDNINRWAFDQLVGGKLTGKLWLEGYITLGEIVNFNEKNAFVVYNSGDKINFRTGINLILSLSENIELSVRYIYTAEEGYRISYPDEGISGISGINYQNNTIIGGLKWTL